MAYPCNLISGLRNQYSVICILPSAICHLYSVPCTMLSALSLHLPPSKLRIPPSPFQLSSGAEAPMAPTGRRPHSDFRLRISLQIGSFYGRNHLAGIPSENPARVPKLGRMPLLFPLGQQGLNFVRSHPPVCTPHDVEGSCGNINGQQIVIFHPGDGSSRNGLG